MTHNNGEGDEKLVTNLYAERIIMRKSEFCETSILPNRVALFWLITKYSSTFGALSITVLSANNLQNLHVTVKHKEGYQVEILNKIK